MLVLQFAREKGLEITSECRKILKQFSASNRRLQALCDYIAEEWGAARVSVISVAGDIGFVLNSAGPDPISIESRSEPRRLGPFLRRVCKKKQMLYAPVAEELGHELQSEGLKHSSLAIPLIQDGNVRAVLCMMADEGQRIPPIDATLLEILTDTLSLEVLSAVAQEVAEQCNKHLFDIARTADALAVESLDHWGHSHIEKLASSRLVLGGDCNPAGPFLDQLRKSPALGKVYSTYRAEIRRIWMALAAAFEFIPKDGRDDFWVMSPQEFAHPLLKTLGPERVAAVLACVLDRHARAIGSKPGFSILGHSGVRLTFGKVPLSRSAWYAGAVELDADGFALLLDLRRQAMPGTVVFAGDPNALSKDGNFSCSYRPWEVQMGKPIFSILHAATDKKEIRRLESLAHEKAKELLRKVS
jgi:hypothetical protein